MDAIKKCIKDYDNGLITARDAYEAINKICRDNLSDYDEVLPANEFRMFEAVLAIRGLDQLKIPTNSPVVDLINCETDMEDELVKLMIDGTELIRMGF